MTYVKTEWETGDVITAEKLNNIEDGIEDASTASTTLKSIIEGTATDIVLPEDITEIGNAYVFLGLSETLTSITMPSVTEICMGAFLECTALESVTMDNVETINGNLNYGAFQGCTSLTSVSLPSVTEIGTNAFFGCSSLESVTIDQTTPPTVRGYAFFDDENIISGLKIYVPADAVATYKADSNWSVYEEVIEAIQ